MNRHQQRIQATVQSALQRGLPALAAVSAPELLVASPEGVTSCEAPLTAALVASALVDSQSPGLRQLAEPYVRYLRETMEPPGRWRLWSTVRPVPPPSVAASAQALSALKRWGSPGIDLGAALEALLAPSGGGPCRRWVLDGGASPAGLANEVDVEANVEVLALANLLGRPVPEIESFVVGFVERGGLEGLSGAGASPFVIADAFGRWIQGGGQPPELVQRVRRAFVQLAGRALGNLLHSALALGGLLRLEGAAAGEGAAALDELASRVAHGQTELGLWAPVPVFTDAEGRTYGSLQITAAVCLAALERYERLSGARAEGAAPTGPGGAAPRGRDEQGRPSTRTWADTLQAVRREIPPVFISPEALGHVGGVARWIPAQLTCGLGFETRLADPTPRADMLFKVSRTKGEREILAGLDRHLALSEELLANPVWRRVQAFSRDWAVAGSELDMLIEGCWFEFDIDGPPAQHPSPVFFFNLEDAAPPRTDAEAQELHRRHWSVSRAALDLLFEGSVPDEIARNLQTCIEGLPAGAQPLSIGMLLARKMEAVRLCVKWISADQVAGYLARIGWPGSQEDLRGLVAWLTRHVDRFVIDLDVAKRLLPSVGLECSFDRRQPGNEPRWAVLLEELVERGYCLPEKRDALLRWPGDFTCTEEVEQESIDNRFNKRLSHVKLGLKPGPAIDAKAYFGIWRDFELRRPR